MQSSLLQLFKDYPALAGLISICVSVIVAILGVIPSIFITAANIIFFGFWQGTLLSFLGESIGAGVAFLLYRKGFRARSVSAFEKYPKLKRLMEAGNKEAFYLVLSLRLLPFVPSGLVSFAAAIGRSSLPVFFLASSLGKIPALLMEAASVYGLMEFGWQAKLISLVAAAGMILYFYSMDKPK